jgi:O-antigen ligase
VKTSSNHGHVSALKQGIHDVVHEPLGRGPGTAGPASAYNNQPARISENFFLQVGQETGLIGLALFLLINGGVGYLLWLRREDPLSLALFASLIGLTAVNLLGHAWADDTLAYIWWGLAGIAMAPNLKEERAANSEAARENDR